MAVVGLLAGVSAAGVLGAAPADAQVTDTVVFAFTDPDVVESSALVVREGLFLTLNDAGNPGRVFVVDPATGDTVGTTDWSTTPVDPEALAPAGDGSVWVGDIGGNLRARSTVQVIDVPVGRTEQTVSAASYDLAYPDGAHDAETLMVNPRTGRLFVATKERTENGSLYRAPKTLSASSPNPLKRVAAVIPVATDGSFFPDGHFLIIRDYRRAAVYRFPSMELLGTFRLPRQTQGEGLAIDERGRVYLSSEGQYSQVLQVSMPRRIKKQVK
ncbi:hypothetical protein [Nocardioides mangrovi]|uniref:SMP-30/Gluconolactonase/LRE-like region domain-containing protein n=1 Tax=Nocardioides mangrovi TaxID=2874580 RepID=A0ABS7UH54_9ACTN|nr:hypothetical protein [Nocardioides mangrovi]MBZ5740326.1 hypothetical protein [Nocardioides mangrovi]